MLAATEGVPHARSYTGPEHSPARCRRSCLHPARRTHPAGLPDGRHPRPVSTPTLRVAIVGAGPAGIYAADILSKSGLDVSIDLIERLPAPFGLVRYGVAPDHPRIKQIIVALHKILERGDIRLLAQRRRTARTSRSTTCASYYDAVIFATGAIRDAALPIPGIDLDGLVRRRGLRVLVRRPPRRAAHLAAGRAAGRRPRRGERRARRRAHPGQARRRPAAHRDPRERLREPQGLARHGRARVRPARPGAGEVLARWSCASSATCPDVDVIVYPEDFDFDEGSMAAIHSSNQTKQVVKTLTDWTLQEPGGDHRAPAHPPALPAQAGRGARRGRQASSALRTERTVLNGDGTVAGTGRAARLARPGRVPRGRVLRLAAGGHPVRRRRRRHPQPRGPRRRRRRRAPSPASTPRAGSSAGRSASSGTPSPTRPRPSGTSSRTSTAGGERYRRAERDPAGGRRTSCTERGVDARRVVRLGAPRRARAGPRRAARPRARSRSCRARRCSRSRCGRA